MPKTYHIDQVRDLMGGANISEDAGGLIMDNSSMEIIAQRDLSDPDMIELIAVHGDDEDELQDFWNELKRVDEVEKMIKRRFGSG